MKFNQGDSKTIRKKTENFTTSLNKDIFSSACIIIKKA